MIEQAIKALGDLAVKAASPQKIDVGNPRALAYVIDGTVVEHEAVAPPRKHTAGTLADLIQLANRFSNDGAYNPVVWYDESAVVLVIDDTEGGGTTGDTLADAHRLETVTFPLATSDVFATLSRLRSNPSWYEQKPFERLLRIDLAGTLEPGVLLNSVRKIVWTASSKATGTVGRQGESLGREITSKADTDGKELPEAVRLMAPVYKTAGERDRYGVNCSVEIDSAECKLQLLPFPDEIERVRQLAVQSIGERLSEGLEGVPAYYGKP